MAIYLWLFFILQIQGTPSKLICQISTIQLFFNILYKGIEYLLNTTSQRIERVNVTNQLQI